MKAKINEAAKTFKPDLSTLLAESTIIGEIYPHDSFENSLNETINETKEETLNLIGNIFKRFFKSWITKKK